jgi:hypothetical protein
MKKIIGTLFLLILLGQTVWAQVPTTPGWSMVSIPGIPDDALIAGMWAEQGGKVFIAIYQYAATDSSKVTVCYYNGVSWNIQLQLLGGKRFVNSGGAKTLFGTSENDVFLSVRNHSTDRSEVYHFNGNVWQQQSMPTQLGSDQLGCFVGERNSVYVGAGSNVFKYDGTSWQYVANLYPRGASCPIYISANEIYFLDCWGHTLWDGTAWTGCQSFDFCDIGNSWGMRDAGNNLYMFATGTNNFGNGIRVWRFVESSTGSKIGSWGSKYDCTYLCDPSGAGYAWAGYGNDIWGSGPNDIYVIGHFGHPYIPRYATRIYHSDGTFPFTRMTNFDSMPLETNVNNYDLHSITGTGPHDIWISVGNKLAHYFSGSQIPAWKLQLTANAGSAVDNVNYLGIAQNASDGFDPMFDTPKPPEPPGSYVQIYFPHPEYYQPLGDNYAQDIRAERALADSVIRWNFNVKTNLSNTDVTLNFISDGNSPTGFGILLKDLTLGTRKNLKKYGMSYTFNSGTEEIHQFEILIGDSTKPTVSLVKPNGGEILRANNPYDIIWTANDLNGIDSVWLYSSTTAGSTYEYIASLSGSNSNYTWSVPSAYLNHNCSISVVASDSMGNTDSDASDHTFTIVGDSLATTFAAAWSLMGTSLKAVDSTVASIFADDISESFYVYGYEPSTGYVQPTWIRHGNGYWLGLLHPFSVDVVGVAVTDRHTISLTPGFNIISNPLVVSVPRDSLQFSKDGATVSYAQALSNGWIATGIQGYNRTLNNYETVDSLQIWSGYWLGVLQTGVEMIVTPPGRTQVPAPLQKTSTPKDGNPIPVLLSKIDKTQSDDWIVNISASTAKGADNSLKFGVKADATDGFDPRYDEPKAPAPPNGREIESYFDHPDWEPILGSRFNCDIRSPRTMQSWVFYVMCAKNTLVTLQWDARLVPATLVMTDNTSGTEISLNSGKSYTFDNEGTRTFTINARTTAVNENGTTPTSFKLEQNYPNPFNPTTIISFSLPSRSFVSLKVFDLMGREVATLVSEELSAGNHFRQWNATDMPSGIYFYRLQADRFTETKGLILLR